uniref:Uncharacterized protein n=1 Tax=Setaria digitata TaxID=48799 RepID=A0A915PYL0_9BILA
MRQAASNTRKIPIFVNATEPGPVMGKEEGKGEIILSSGGVIMMVILGEYDDADADDDDNVDDDDEDHGDGNNGII